MKNDKLAQIAQQVIAENTVTIDIDFVGDQRDIDKARRMFNVKIEPIRSGRAPAALVTGDKQDIIRWLTSADYDMAMDDVKEFFPELFEAKKEAKSEDDDTEEEQIDERRFDFKEFDEMEKAVTNKGALKAFTYALGMITDDLLNAGYDEKKIMSFIVALFEER